MDWEKELSGQLTAALAGLTPAPFPPDDRWNSLTFLDLEGAEAGKRWKKLAARALKRAKTFEIHCWSEEPEAVSLALEYGERRATGWAYGVVVTGPVTPAFEKMVLGQPAGLEDHWTPFFNLNLDGRFFSSHWGRELSCCPELLEDGE